MNTTIHGLTPFPFRIVRIVADRELEGIESCACHQLLPELAECLSGKQYAIFVDASLDSEAKDVSVETVIPTVSNAVDGHLSDPGSLLALSQALYGQTARAWLVRVPVARCDLGADLSTLAQASMNAALAGIRRWLIDLDERAAEVDDLLEVCDKLSRKITAFSRSL